MARSDENSAAQFTIAPDDVRTTAELARLHLRPEELDRTAAELSRILQYAATLKQVAVDGVEPTVHAVPQVSPLRADAVGPHDDLTAALRNAPLSQDRFFVVPAIFEHGDEG